MGRVAPAVLHLSGQQQTEHAHLLGFPVRPLNLGARAQCVRATCRVRCPPRQPQIFDQHMREPNQIASKPRADVRVTKEELLKVCSVATCSADV